MDKALTCMQKATVNGSISKWRLVMGGFPQGSVLGIALFNVFVGDMDNRTESTLSMFADDTKICGTIDTLGGKDALQKNFDKFQRWACANLMKCKALYVDHVA